MGLIKGEQSHQTTAVLRAWSAPGITIAVAAILALYGTQAQEWLRYDRSAIAEGELWRLITAHFVHLNWPHFALNAMGLLLVCFLVSARFNAVQWLLIALLTMAGIDLGFWLLEPQLAWYVGLSGLLHGLLAAGVVAGLFATVAAPRGETVVLAVLLTVKLVYEQLVGPLPGSEQSSGGNVIVAAHFYGALTGAAAAAWISLRNGGQATI